MDTSNTTKKDRDVPFSRQMTLSQIWKYLDQKYSVNPDCTDKQTSQEQRMLQTYK